MPLALLNLIRLHGKAAARRSLRGVRTVRGAIFLSLGGLMILMSVAFTALWGHVTADPNLLAHHLDPRRARQESALFSAGLLAYVAGVGLAFISAQLSLLVYGLVALFYVFPWLPEAPPPDAGPRDGQQSPE